MPGELFWLLGQSKLSYVACSLQPKTAAPLNKKLRCDDVIRVLLAEMSDVGSNLGHPDFYGL